MSFRSVISQLRLSLRGISRAQAAASAASAAAPNPSVDVLFPAALGFGEGKGPRALAVPSSTFGGGSQGYSVPGVPVLAVITLATFSTCYLLSGEASAKGKPAMDAEKEASAKGKPAKPAKDAEKASAKGEPKEKYGGLPAYVNWVEKGAVTPPKAQGNCGSCWAHTSVSAVESGYQIKTGKLIAMSTQQLIDCSVRRFGIDDGPIIVGRGCEGGNFPQAFKYILAYGLMSAKSYPNRWLLHQGDCRYKEEKVVATIRTYDFSKPSEIELMGAVAIRPVAVFMDRCPKKLKTYSGGIIEIEDWPPAKDEEDFGKHAVLVVGYGTDADGNDYWLIKNSWGTSWGEKGYGRIRRGTGNPLGVGGINRVHGVFPVM